MIKKFCVAAIVTVMASLPVVAQETPMAGGGRTAAWLDSLPTGSWVIIGGVLFVMTGEGLIRDDRNPLGGTPTPTPTPTPSPTTTTTTTTP